MPQAVQLQWGHGDEAVEEAASRSSTAGTMIGFNGATAMKPWKRLLAQRVRDRSTGCFNGATAMKPWKRSSAVTASGHEIAASMGPRR